MQVYGITHAKVSIGYQYSTCTKIMWEIHAATMKGFEVDTSDIGGWSLDVHHHYNFHEGNTPSLNSRILPLLGPTLILPWVQMDQSIILQYYLVRIQMLQL